MTEFFKAELKDKILEYATYRDDYFETHVLYDEFLKPNYNIKEVEKLVADIIDYDADLLDIISGNGIKIFMISSTAYTTDFLENGGFKRLYIKEEEKWDAFLNHMSISKKLSGHKKEKLASARQSEIFKKEKVLLVALILAVVFSFVYTLIGIISTLFGPDYISEEKFDAKIEEIKIEHKSETDRLKREINALRQAKLNVNDSLIK